MAPIEYIDGCELNAALEASAMRTDNKSLAMAYVPYQEFEELYDDTEALYNGTLFKKLNLPFLGRRFER